MRKTVGAGKILSTAVYCHFYLHGASYARVLAVIVCLSVCLPVCVCVSVTCQYCIKTAKRRIMAPCDTSFLLIDT